MANINHRLLYVSCLVLGVSGDSDNRDLISGWTIIPKNPIRSRSVLFCISFEYFFPMWPLKARELMCLQAIVARIGCQ
jgi:hypothetical protein